MKKGKQIHSRKDDAPVKRIELHAKTGMSALDGLGSVTDLIARAANWGHRAIAITDFHSLQGFPEAMSAAGRNGIKLIPGCEFRMYTEDAEKSDEYAHPPVIDIPDNVVFVGTLNMDETTKGISPKVLDRSYMIEISNNFDLNTQIDSFDTVEELKITPVEFKKIRSTSNRAEITEKKAEDPVELAKSIKNILDVWNKQAEHHKDVDGLREIHFSHRFLRQLAAMIEPKELSDLLADILAGKILPLMQCDNMPDKNRKEVKAEILKLCGSDSYIVDKFDRMARNDGQVNFWWR